MEDVDESNNNALAVFEPAETDSFANHLYLPAAFTIGPSSTKLKSIEYLSGLTNFACSFAMMVPSLLLCLFFLSLQQFTSADLQIPDDHQTGGGHARCRSIECPKYTVVDVDAVRDFEVREYQNPLWVFAMHRRPAASYQKALCTQAPILSSYLKGNNDFNTTISETAPALTVVIPGLYHADRAGVPFGDTYRLARYLPQNSQLTAPPPSNTTVRFWGFPPENHYVVVKEFTEGAINDTRIALALASLRDSLKGSPWESRVRPYGGFAVADYNYPDTNGTTKNEILILAEKKWLNGGGL